jgi:hypothetical protein
VARIGAVIAVSALAIVACGGGQIGGHHAGLRIFNDCIARSHFLVLAYNRSGSEIVEVIRDRVRGETVGEVASGRPAATLGGAAAGNGRLTMSTATPLGRDATAIERCWDRFSPIAPSS